MRRYTEIKQSDLTAAQAAKLTREFRCPPQEQMRALLAFRKEDLENDDPTKIECPCSDELRAVLWNFHCELLKHCGHPGPQVSLLPCHQLQLTILLYKFRMFSSNETPALVTGNQIIIIFIKYIQINPHPVVKKIPLNPVVLGLRGPQGLF